MEQVTKDKNYTFSINDIKHIFTVMITVLLTYMAISQKINRAEMEINQLKKESEDIFSILKKNNLDVISNSVNNLESEFKDFNKKFNEFLIDYYRNGGRNDKINDHERIKN